MSFLNLNSFNEQRIPPQTAPAHIGPITSIIGVCTTVLGILFKSGSSAKMLLSGFLIEAGRRLFRWIWERLGISYSTTILLTQGDLAYEWIFLLLAQENVWRRSREFVVSAHNSQRKWSVHAAADFTVNSHTEFVPIYKQPHLFRWRGHWVEIKHMDEHASSLGGGLTGSLYRDYGSEMRCIILTIYTRNMTVVSDFVEDARVRYDEINHHNVVIRLANPEHRYNPVGSTWITVKNKTRHDLSSIILPDGVLNGILDDAREFLDTEGWYMGVGIPYRRGYLLYGPPGAGKTSTIYAVAGALNLEIYSLSLASNFVDDGFLQRAVSSIPRNGLLLIEDIDCAFPAARDDEEDEDSKRGSLYAAMRQGAFPLAHTRQSAVTLSGLLNVIDGVGSEEGKLFFCTTNFIDRLDSALLRPGRIDKKIEYRLATTNQARALFFKFFPQAKFSEYADAEMDSLAEEFAQGVPECEFSTAELQGYLQGHKMRPSEAAWGVRAWVDGMKEERTEAEGRKEARREKARRMQAAQTSQAHRACMH